MIDEALLYKAMITSGYTEMGRFGAEVLNADERTARRWHNGEKDLPGSVRLICHAIIERPALAGELKALLQTGRVKPTARPGRA